MVLFPCFAFFRREPRHRQSRSSTCGWWIWPLHYHKHRPYVEQTFMEIWFTIRHCHVLRTRDPPSARLRSNVVSAVCLTYASIYTIAELHTSTLEVVYGSFNSWSNRSLYSSKRENQSYNPSSVYCVLRNDLNVRRSSNFTLIRVYA